MAIKKRIITAAAAVVLALSALPVSAFADNNETKNDAEFEKKNVTTFIYSKQKKESLGCLFLKELPEVPYVNVEDYLDRIYTKDYTTKAKGNVYTISGNGMKLVADTSKETVTITGFDSNIQRNVVEVEKADVADYIKESKPVVEGAENPVTLDYSKYNIDLIGDSGKLYFPLTTISDMFDCTYRAAEYIDNNLYFLQTLSVTSDKDGYFDRSSVYEQTERSQAMIDYTYNELCFLMDHFYGKPPKAPISKSIAQKGFDKALDDYSEIKQMLKSKKRAEFQLGLLLLSDAVDDGGHTLMCAGVLGDIEYYGENEKCKMLSRFQVELMFSEKASEIINRHMSGEENRNLVEKARTAKLKDATLVKKWDEHKTALYVKGETAMFRFDHFEHPVVRDFAWSLDYASKNGVKNFVIDIATNTGGDESIAHFINTIITNKQKNSNKIISQMRDTVTGTILDTNWISDLDLNGVFNEKDKSVYYDFNYAMLTSNNSFSSGNLMPCMAKDRGILVMGETSGGGTCMVSKHYYPDGTYYMTSGINTILRSDKTDVDSGAKVDFDLTAKNKDGSTDYSNFYDFDKINDCINKFYGIKLQEKPQVKPQVKPEVKPDVKPDVKPVPVTVKTDDVPPETGHVGDTVTVAVLLIAAGAIAVIRKEQD